MRVAAKGILGLLVGWTFTTCLVLVSLFLVAAEAAQLTLTWNDMSGNEDGFQIQRKTGANGTFGSLATVGAGVTGYIDGTVSAGTTYCYRVSAYNTAGNSAFSNEACAAAATPVTYAVTVAKNGAGTVASSPGGISCGATCSASFASGTSIALSATPASGSTFTGWSGACTGTGSCTLIVDAAKDVTATFASSGSVTFGLTVTKSGAGSGTVTSIPTGINCGSTCSTSFASGANVTLTAAPATGSTFTGWSGACTGTGTCSVSMTAARSVTATFAASAAATYTLNIARAGTGNGTITSSPSGINCGSTCSTSFASGANVTLTAAPATGSTFTGWSGACTGTGTCSVSMTAARSVTATFAAQTPQPISLASFTSNVSGSPTAGTPITYTASPSGGSTPYQYKWWVGVGNGWTLLRDWSTSNTHVWTPTTPGQFTFHVWVRNNGTMANAPEAYGYLPVTVTAAPPLVLTAFAGSANGTSVVGSPITYTATPSGGTAPYQYRWWVWNGATWILLQDWTASNTYTWTPGTAGSYTFHVWVRSNGTSGNPPEAYGYLPMTVTATPGLTLTTFTASPTGSQPAGTTITYTAGATGGTGPYQYRWWVWDGATWTLLRDWTTRNTRSWTPGTPGNYVFHVWVRSNGTSGNPPEAYGYLPVTVR